jgi:glycosyltransferase involved in cell wall biosynthesis
MVGAIGDSKWINHRPVTRPLVSVVVPFFNRASFLHDIVKTVEQQSLREIELIIVDDASTDQLVAHVDALRTNFPVRFLRLARNSGGASARNAGIVEARGCYIAFLDSDDSWSPHKLRKQLEHLQNADDPSRLVSLTRQLVVQKHTLVAPRRLMEREDSVGQYLFQLGGKIQSSMMFMTSSLAKDVRFVEGMRAHEDWSFALRLEQFGAQFEMLPEPLTIYNDETDRTRSSPSYGPPRLNWLEGWRKELGEGPYLAARAAFLSNMPGRSLETIKTIRDALIGGAIPLWQATYYAAAWGAPSIRNFGVLAHTAWLRLNAVDRAPRRVLNGSALK